jgi:hypothetical protein
MTERIYYQVNPFYGEGSHDLSKSRLAVNYMASLIARSQLHIGNFAPYRMGGKHFSYDTRRIF